MQDFQTVWATSTGGTGQGSGVGGTSTREDHQGQSSSLSSSTDVEGQGPILDAIDRSPFNQQEVRLLLDAAHVVAFLIVSYYAIKET